MQELLAWYNIIFILPIGLGIMLALGSALGMGGHDAAADHDMDHDLDHGVDHGTEHDHDASHDHGVGKGPSFLMSAASILGVGRAPVMVVLMMATLIFGALGFILNQALKTYLLTPYIYFWISLGVAFFGMILLTGKAASVISHLMPTMETAIVTKHDLVGQCGKLLVPTDAVSGFAQVKDGEGNVHNLPCRTEQGRLATGKDVLVTDYDAKSGKYVVVERPEELEA